MPTFKFVQSVICAVAILCVASCFTMRFPVFGQDTNSTRTRLTSLLEERRDVLKTRVEALEALFKIARSPREAVTSARNDLLDAEYELATNRAQRIDVLQQKLANAKEYESLMEQQNRDARVTQADVLMATARRLGVEIELLREQE